MSNTPFTSVNAEGTVLKTVSVASNGEQIGATAIGLLTAGPIGALAAWGAIRMFAGKWTPWIIVGAISIVPINLFQLAVLSGIIEASNDSTELVAPSTSE